MSNYTQSTNFATKDALSSGDPLKIVKGTEINTEFVNISVAIATKADLASPTFTGTPLAPTASAATNNTQIATTAYTDAAVTAATAAIKTALFPVGAIYTAIVSTNPGTLLGFGTWTAFGTGRVMVGIDTSDAGLATAEQTGGSKDAITVTHTHTATSVVTDAGHSHGLMGADDTGITRGLSESTSRNVQGGDSTTNRGYKTTAPTGGENLVQTQTTGVTVATTNASTGSSGTNANMQPYIVVYMWKRTA
jgi:hypothetical protein